MGRELSIVLGISVIGIIAFTVLLFALGIIQKGIGKADEVEIEKFVLVGRPYVDSMGILIIDLQNVGSYLDSIEKEDFVWWIGDQYMGPVYSVTFPHEDSTGDENGDIVQIGLKIGENSSGTKIKLRFRGGPQIVITVP
ncbi:MAG: hypothetical protein HXS54_13790 [Theionarchaea archaeon]|nr:hypothetical protein [Theionarchaea archaeon]